MITQEAFTGPDQAHARSMGTENELHVQPQGEWVQDLINRERLADLGIRSVDVDEKIWFENGMAAYNDQLHAEVCSAESDGPLDAAISNEATARFPALAFHGSISETSEEIIIHRHAASYIPPRSNRRGAVGSHAERASQLTAMMPSVEGEGDTIETLQTLLDGYASTASWAGAGALSPRGFQIIQKTQTGTNLGLRDLYEISPANAKEIVDPGWLRVERRVGDANRSFLVNYVDYAANSLIIRMAEHHELVPDNLPSLMPKNSLTTLWQVAHDLTLKETFLCFDGKARTAFDIQRILINQALVLDHELPLPEDESAAIPLWQRAVDIMQRTNPAAGEINDEANFMHWAFRMQSLGHLTEDPPHLWNSTTHPQLNTRSLYLDMVHPKDVLRRYATRTMGGLCTEQLVEGRMRHPPPNTGAAARGEFIRQHGDKITVIGWRSGEYHGRSGDMGVTFNTDDPVLHRAKRL